jgi:hypothetical protein
MVIENDVGLQAAYDKMSIRESGLSFVNSAGGIQFPLNNERYRWDGEEERRRVVADNI